MSAHLIRKIDVPWRVDEVERIHLPVLGLVSHASSVQLDGDTPLSLQVHAVHELRLKIERRLLNKVRCLPTYNVLTCMSLSATVSVFMSSWSANVDFPWSMCAMIEKFLMLHGGTLMTLPSS